MKSLITTSIDEQIDEAGKLASTCHSTIDRIERVASDLETNAGDFQSSVASVRRGLVSRGGVWRDAGAAIVREWRNAEKDERKTRWLPAIDLLKRTIANCDPPGNLDSHPALETESLAPPIDRLKEKASILLATEAGIDEERAVIGRAAQELLASCKDLLRE